MMILKRIFGKLFPQKKPSAPGLYQAETEALVELFDELLYLEKATGHAGLSARVTTTFVGVLTMARKLAMEKAPLSQPTKQESSRA